MHAVGIDVSKGKNIIAVMLPFGVVVASPYEVCHTESELSELASFLKSLPGETKVIIETLAIDCCSVCYNSFFVLIIIKSHCQTFSKDVCPLP